MATVTNSLTVLGRLALLLVALAGVARAQDPTRLPASANVAVYTSGGALFGGIKVDPSPSAGDYNPAPGATVFPDPWPSSNGATLCAEGVSNAYQIGTTGKFVTFYKDGTWKATDGNGNKLSEGTYQTY